MPRRLWALPLAVAALFIASAFALTGTAAKRRWDTIVALLPQAAIEPNGRRRPSVLAQFRGWMRQAVAQEKNRTHRQQMAPSVET